LNTNTCHISRYKQEFEKIKNKQFSPGPSKLYENRSSIENFNLLSGNNSKKQEREAQQSKLKTKIRFSYTKYGKQIRMLLLHIQNK
jgi:hypothetical protein